MTTAIDTVKPIVGIPDNIVTLDGDTCTIRDIRRIAYQHASVRIAPQCWERVRAARTIVERILERKEPVYGLNTGLGSMKKYLLDPAAITAFNRDIVLAHSVPMDTEPLSVGSVRAIIASRINGMIRGGTGVRPELIEMLVELLNRGVHPVVHGYCVSVGESDLSPLAEIGLVIIGEGYATYQGERMSGLDALTRAGLYPLQLEAREGLGLISANSYGVGGGALIVSEAWQLVTGFEYATALSFEAFRANPNVLHEQSIAARRFVGQRDSAYHLRTLLAGGDLLSEQIACNLQDPLSFRCAAQVHGAVRDVLEQVGRSVEDMLNSSVDSPLALIELGRLQSTGNFESTALSLAFDHLRLALHRLVLMSTQRLNKLLWQEFTRLPSLLLDSSESSHRLGMLYNNLSRSAAVLAAQSQTTAMPAGVSYTPQVTEGLDDYASMAPIALTYTWDMLWIVRRSIILELLIATRVLQVREQSGGMHRLGKGTASLYRWVQALKAAHDLEGGAGALEHLIREFRFEELLERGAVAWVPDHDA